MGKKVELNNVEIFNVVQGCNMIQKNFDLITSLDFKVTKINKTLSPHVEDYQEKVESLKKKFAKKDEDGTMVTEKDENDREIIVFQEAEGEEKSGKEKFEEEVKKLEDEKIEVHLPTILKFDDFVDENGKYLKFKEKGLGGVTYMIDPIVEL